MSKSNIVLNNVVLINNGRAADFLKWIQLLILNSKLMTKENKTRLIRFLWNLASAILAAVGTALGVSCAVA